MALLPSMYRILTLQASLMEVIRLGEAYLIAEAGEDWRPKRLLEVLEEKHPDLLQLPVALVPPDPNESGAVFAVDLEGAPLTDTLLYRIERRRPTVSPI